MEIALAELNTTTSLPTTTKGAMNVAQDEMYVDITDTEQVSPHTVNETENSCTTAQAAGSTTEDGDRILYYMYKCVSRSAESINEVNPRR